jgi:hypothetical protein
MDLIPEKRSTHNVSSLAKSQEGRWSRDGLVLLPLQPGVDEAAVEGHRVLRGDAIW